MAFNSVALLFLLAVAACPYFSYGETHFLNWNITWAKVAPNCVTKTVATINGVYPGPPVELTTGDRIVAKICNNIFFPVAMHWHGFHFSKQQWYDGPAFGAQCPIEVDDCFTYNFTVPDQHGTYWYHGHIDLLRASVYGALIVHPKKDAVVPFAKPEGEFYALLNDWYNKYNGDIIKGLHSKNWQFIGMADSLLVNGRGLTWCKNYYCPYEGKTWKCGKCDRKHPDCNPLTTYIVKPGKTYRFRIINVGLWAQMNFAIEGHNFTIVLADGNYLKPRVYDSVDINPGQSFDVLVTTDQEPRNYWISINGRYDNVGQDPPGLAVLKYKDSPVFNQTQPWVTPWPTGPDYEDVSFGPFQQMDFRNHEVIPGLADKKVDRYLSIQWDNQLVDGYVRYSVNNNSFQNPKTPLLAAEYYGIEGQFDTDYRLSPEFPVLDKKATGFTNSTYGTKTLTAYKGEFVQIVLQSNKPPGNHPWHLHGHDFYVIGYGKGVYDFSKEKTYKKKLYNLKDPPLRNMVTVYQDHWVAIRFTANPGVWNFHCHMEPHMELGMQTYLRVVGEKGDIPPPPPGYPSCGSFGNYTKSYSSIYF